MMTCREFVDDFLMAYLDGELDPQTRAEFQRHLELCPPCQDYLDSYRATVQLERLALGASEAAEPGGAIPAELVQAILAARKK